MFLHVLPSLKLRGTVPLPASKSYSIRAFFVAACGGRSRILGASDCDDARVAMKAARVFGAAVTPVPGGVRVDMPVSRKIKAKLVLDAGESGTSLRFLLPLLPHYAATAMVKGRGTLVGRPNHHLCAALRAGGLMIRGAGANESVPISFSGGVMAPGRVSVDGSLSSQFISALMIAAPLGGRETRLVMAGRELVSRDYVTMTRQVLARAGIRVEPRGRREFLIPGGQVFRGLGSFRVPSDYGLAAYFMAAAALVPSDILLKGCFDDGLIQSDGAILGFFDRMGLRMSRATRGIRIKGPQVLRGGVFSLKDCPDLLPVMAVTAMFAEGETRFTDIAHARVKESDRISDLRAELLKTGADIREKADELIVRPCPAYRQGVVLDPHHDHRLAMAFAVLGLKVGARVKDIGCTSKSYPGFVKALRNLGSSGS